MEFRVCALCGVPVDPKDLLLHCMLDRMDERERERTAVLEEPPPPPPKPRVP